MTYKKGSYRKEIARQQHTKVMTVNFQGKASFSHGRNDMGH